MNTKEHKKHSDLTRPSYGHFCRNEWVIMGATCNVIRATVKNVFGVLSSTYKCAYADEQHSEKKEETGIATASDQPFTEYCGHPRQHSFTFINTFNQFRFRQELNDIDVLLVNGNHFQAKSQVVIIDSNREESLRKRISQLTNVELFLLAGNEEEISSFVKEAVPGWRQVPVLKLTETGKIAAFFLSRMQQAKPAVYGLVLAGGKSVRLGYDKRSISWHGKEQQYYLAELLKNVCKEVYISCRPDQQPTINSDYKTISDTFTGLGPFGAILSAFRENPNVAWLVVACDLPLLNLETLKFLQESRNTSSIATAFSNAENNLPEPLIAIWEPKSYPVLLTFLSQGYNCPGKVLQNSSVQLLKAPDPGTLTNVNTPLDFELAQISLQKKLAVNDAT